MTTIDEELSKAAPGPLALVQALVNTQYGQGRRAHMELTSPEQLRAWLVARRLLPDGTPVTEGDFRRVLQLREALRSLLRANNDRETPASQVEVLNRLASNAPLTVRFQHDGVPTLEPDIAGVDGVLGVRWPAAAVVSRRVPIGIGAQHIWREKEKREPEVLMRENQDRRGDRA